MLEYLMELANLRSMRLKTEGKGERKKSRLDSNEIYLIKI